MEEIAKRAESHWPGGVGIGSGERRDGLCYVLLWTFYYNKMKYLNYFEKITL